MARLSITTAWNETVAFIGREAQLILPIAFLLLALPGAGLQLVMPTPAPGVTPEFPPILLLLVPLAILAGMVGSIAITFLALRPGRSVGEALQRGLGRFLILFAASLLIGLAALILFVPLLVLFAGGAALTGGATPAAAAGPMLLVFLIFLVVMITFWVRLLPMNAVAAAEDVGPIGIITRSWALTSGYFWKLLGFVLLLCLAAIIVSVAISAVLGILLFLAAGPPEPGSVSMIVMMIVSALIQSVLSAIFLTLIARIYAQLAGGDDKSEVFA